MRLNLWLAAVAAISCTAHFDLPMTAQTSVNEGSGDALVAYLGQADASASICDLSAKTPHLSFFTEDDRGALIAGLLKGQVGPKLWAACIDVLLERLPPERGAALLDALAPAYKKLITRAELEADPAVAARLSVLHQLYLGRKNGLNGDPSRVGPMIEDLRAALARPTFGPVATRFGQELVAVADLERGLWEGKAVDVKALDALETAGDEATLARFSRRLPDIGLREEARRRIVRVHIAASPFPEVRETAAAVEALVLKEGRNPVSLAQHTLVRATLNDPGPQRAVQVLQDVGQQRATLLGIAAARAEVSVLPELQLKGTLTVQLTGISRPVGVCGPPADLDVSPCLAIEDLSLDNPLARLDAAGAVHFKDELTFGDVLALAKSPDFTVQLRIASKPGVSLQWALMFRRPDDLVLFGPGHGENGPSLGVRVDRTSTGRWIFDVAAPSGRWVSVVENNDLGGYKIATIGSQGFTGATGYSGSPGYSGGQCQNGGPGTSGGPGGQGGRGGNGGEVLVTVGCAATTCRDSGPYLQRVIVSEGGKAGLGGSGGAGGYGGSGGFSRSATTHTDGQGNTITDDPGCMSGSTGPQGYRGPDGPAGNPGQPGTVRFSLTR